MALPDRVPPLDDAAARAVQAARDAGADQADAWCEESVERTVRVHRGEVESLEEAVGRGIGLRVFRGGRTGFAYSSDLSEASLTRLGGVASRLAAATDPDEYAGLPAACGAADVAGLSGSGFGIWDNERRATLAAEAEAAARGRDGRITQVEESVYGESRDSVALANSLGFAAGFERTDCYAYVSALAGSGADRMSGFAVRVGRDPQAIDPRSLGAEAADRALALLGGRKPSSRTCPVVFDSHVAASLVGQIGATLSADAVQHGISPFARRAGEAVSSEAFELADDGLDPEGLRSAPFDGEGVPCARTPLIASQRVAGMLYDSACGRRGGRESTGNANRDSYRAQPAVAPTNLVVAPGAFTLGELFQKAGSGLFVTQVSGLHSGVNAVTGAFSVGAAGRLIEGGELGPAVRELTIAGDLVDLMRSIVAVGSDLRWHPLGGSVRTPELLVSRLTVGGR